MGGLFFWGIVCSKTLKLKENKVYTVGGKFKINIKDMILDDSPPGIFIGFRYESKLDQEVHVSREKSDVFNVTVVDHELTRHATRSEGIIDSSLYMTGKKVVNSNFQIFYTSRC